MNEVKKKKLTAITEFRSNIVFDQKIQKSVEWPLFYAELAKMDQCWRLLLTAKVYETLTRNFTKKSRKDARKCLKPK